MSIQDLFLMAKSKQTWKQSSDHQQVDRTERGAVIQWNSTMKYEPLTQATTCKNLNTLY